MAELDSPPGLAHFVPLRQPSSWGRQLWSGEAASTVSREQGVGGGVRLLLRAEGVVVLAAALAAYAQFGAGWGVFTVWLLAPDLSMLGYLTGPRVGAALYNAAHSYAGAVALLVLGALAAMPWAVAGGLIWCVHIGLDRALGYGLKYGSGFGATHLGRIGPADPW
ncbi:DUF4260 domain-containing protein [Variovorax paradoxus]|uniref:DUF4260 domain-containing protein n=1 Tax=Variovorax paradoxus TaxID=34073 RepID=UPI0024800EC9|nr:DUF4260 domain-containing protein [Variovorax paradoxus]WGT61691.1 DUF4260 domain-containing protein [Variovorax paradoxus]